MTRRDMRLLYWMQHLPGNAGPIKYKARLS